MAYCLMASSHYLNQCWLMISEVLWHSPQSNFTGDVQDIYPWYELKITNWRLQPYLPVANELTYHKWNIFLTYYCQFLVSQQYAKFLSEILLDLRTTSILSGQASVHSLRGQGHNVIIESQDNWITENWVSKSSRESSVIVGIMEMKYKTCLLFYYYWIQAVIIMVTYVHIICQINFFEGHDGLCLSIDTLTCL